MDTRFLETFVTVVDTGSIAEAARVANLTPAAVAQRIRALEAEIGAPLLARSGRVVRPTEAAVAIVDRARLFVRDIRDLKTLATGEAPTGELRLGAIASAVTGLLPAVLRRLTARHPGIGIYVVPGNSVGLYRQIVAGELDAAVLVKPPFALPKSCEWRPLRKEPLIVLAPEAVPERDPHTLLRSRPFIRYDRNHWGGRLVDQYLRRVGIRPNERFELDALDAIAVLVDGGLGVSLVPAWPPPWPEGLRLVRLAVPVDGFEREIGLIWPRASARIRLVRAVLHEALAPEGGDERSEDG